VVTIEIAPLRHRPVDVPPLLDHFLRDAMARYPGSAARRFSDEALALLLAYAWPGNVRELGHAVERMVLLSKGAVIEVADLPPAVRAAPGGAAADFRGPVMPVRDLQRRYARWALGQLGGHRAETAAKLGIDPKTLATWIKEADEG
jgi:DNA-binding NtrC family response regulator